MDTELTIAHIEHAIEEAKKLTPSREVSLVITKLEEALMWCQSIKSLGEYVTSKKS